jgi:hypothetical protein
MAEIGCADDQCGALEQVGSAILDVKGRDLDMGNRLR